MFLLKSKKPVRRGISAVILAVEIAAIMILHAFKLNHHSKSESSKVDVVSQQANINATTSYTFSNLR